MKIDHHGIRITLDMFHLKPDEITDFVNWLIRKRVGQNEFLDMGFEAKREMYFKFKEESQETVNEKSDSNLS